MADPAVGALWPELLGFALVGVLGGAHCLGMCGPLVTLYADRFDRTRPPEDRGGAAAETDGGTVASPVGHPTDRGFDWGLARQQVTFNLGRTAGYATIGTLLGAVGSLTYQTAGFLAVGDGVRAVAGVLAGAIIMVVGLRYLAGGAPGSHVPGVDRLAGAVTGRLTAHVDDWVNGPRVALLGAAHGLLPCPILYPAFLYALAVGSPLRGGLALGALGLGTVPTMLAYGTAVGSLGPGTRARVHRALGAAFVVLALVPLTHGLGLAGLPVPMVPLPSPW